MRHKIILAALLASFGCTMPTQPNAKTQVQTPARSNVNNQARFSYHTAALPGARLNGTDLEKIVRKGYPALLFDPDRTYVEFESLATDSDISTFQKTNGATVTRRLPQVESTNAARTLRFEISFGKPQNDLSRFQEVATELGLTGEYSFSSARGADALVKVLNIGKAKKKFKIRHIGLGVVVPFDRLTKEGDCLTSPTVRSNAADELLGGFWHHGDFVSGGRAGNRINMLGQSSWDIAKGAGVKVAVVDNDFLLPGEPLHAQLLGDSNEYYTWNIASSTTDVGTYDPVTSQTAGHGRKMASLIFSSPDDSRGVAGVAPMAKPMLLHVGTIGGGLDGNQLALAIDKARIDGAQIINMSWGVYASPELADILPYRQAIADASYAGIILAASTGNDGFGTHYPSTWAEVMGVSGHDWNGLLAWYDYGSYNAFANDFDANIYANGVQGGMANDIACPHLGSEVSYHGTSGATALVSGACALYLERGKISNTFNAIDVLRQYASTGPDGRKVLNVYGGL